jgi:cytochrome d ubiquinol oxidase subunit I
MLSVTAWLLTVLVPLQILLGDAHGLNTLKYQPAKLAAIEAHWNRESHAPLTLFAIPDQARETNHFAIEMPELGSLVLTHSFEGVVPGLKDYKPADRAPVIFPFFAFRVMVGLGVLMLGIVLIALWLRFRKRLYDSIWFLRLCEYAAPIGFLAVLAGWTTTETGRQPWTVYGLMRTADSVSPSLTGLDVLISLVGYMIVYLIMFPSGLILMRNVVRKGMPSTEEKDTVAGGRPSAPVVAPPEALR